MCRPSSRNKFDFKSSTGPRISASPPNCDDTPRRSCNGKFVTPNCKCWFIINERRSAEQKRPTTPESRPFPKKGRKRLFSDEGDGGTDERAEDKVDADQFLDTYEPPTTENQTLRPEKPTNANSDQTRKKKAQSFRQVGKQTSKPLTNPQEALLKKVYYDQNFTVGRDALWYKIRNNQNCPTWRQVADWVNRQAVAQRYSLVRSHGGLVNSFVPPLKVLARDICGPNRLYESAHRGLF